MNLIMFLRVITCMKIIQYFVEIDIFLIISIQFGRICSRMHWYLTWISGIKYVHKTWILPIFLQPNVYSFLDLTQIVFIEIWYFSLDHFFLKMIRKNCLWTIYQPRILRIRMWWEYVNETPLKNSKHAWLQNGCGYS